MEASNELSWKASNELSGKSSNELSWKLQMSFYGKLHESQWHDRQWAPMGARYEQSTAIFHEEIELSAVECKISSQKLHPNLFVDAACKLIYKLFSWKLWELFLVKTCWAFDEQYRRNIKQANFLNSRFTKIFQQHCITICGLLNPSMLNQLSVCEFPSAND